MAGQRSAIRKRSARPESGAARNQPHELITTYTDPVKKGPTMRGPGREDNIWPDDVHSNKPHQQYADFLKSKMCRNSRLLVTCSDCHDMHGGTPYRGFLLHDPDDSGSPLCQRCHPGIVRPNWANRLKGGRRGGRGGGLNCIRQGRGKTGGVEVNFGRMIKTSVTSA